MKRKAKQLEFISLINRDGSGTTEVSEKMLKCMLENEFCKDEKYEINCLSASNKTFIASGFNSFVVKLNNKNKNKNKK